MICKQCDIEKTENEMKTLTKCIECERKNRKEYNRKYRKSIINDTERKIKKQEYDKSHYQENRDKKIEQSKTNYENIKNDPIKFEKRRKHANESAKARNKTPKRKEQIKASKQKYRKNNREKINAYQRNRRQTNEQHRLSENLRRRITKIINKQGIQKTWRGEITQDLTMAILNKLGPRPDKTFHLDHIIPLSVFDLTKKEHRLLANSPSNVQWLPELENCSKNDYIDLDLIRSSPELLKIAQTIGLVDFV